MIPRWFIDRRNSYGPRAMILPPDLLKPMRLSRKSQTYHNLRISHIFCSSSNRFLDLPWIIRWAYKIERHPQYPFPMLTRKFKLKWWNKFNFNHICQELQKIPLPPRQKVLISFWKKVKSSVSLPPSQTENSLRNSSVKLHHKFQMMKMTQ